MKRKLFPGIFIFVVLLVFALGYLYFFNISPRYSKEPEIQKPQNFNRVTADHLIYFLFIIDAYKLHPHTFSGELPLIEFLINDTNKTYFFSVENNEILPTEKGDPDIIFISTEEIIMELIKKEYVDNFLRDYVNSEEIILKAVGNESDLALKGYKVIYDKLLNDVDNISGNLVSMGVNNFRNGIQLTTLLALSLVLWMIIKIES